MTLFKFYSMCFSVIMISGCAGFQTKPYSLSNQKTDLITEYCQSGTQKKAYKTTVLYFFPNLEPKLSIDKANLKNQKLSEQKNELLKKLFYVMGDATMTEQVVNQGDQPGWYLLVSDSEKDVLNNISEEDSNTKYRLITFIVKILNQNKIVVYQSNQNSRRMNYDKGYSTDLNDLMNEYTILAPKEVVEKMTGSEFNSQYPYSSIILDENGQIDISKAVRRKNDVWKAYIRKFTSIKEASEDNSRKSSIELSLDLNVFCKYGRKISDLQSQ